MRQDEVAEVLDRESLPGQAFLERAQARRGPAIDQRRLVTGEEVRRDHPRAPEVLEVDPERQSRTVFLLLTVSVPSIPAARCPSTEQKNV